MLQSLTTFIPQGSGIGRATAASFARAGATKIILIGRHKVNLEETQRSLPCAELRPAIDVRDEQAVAEVASEVGRWDVLILATGHIPTPAFILDSSVDEWWAALEVRSRPDIATLHRCPERPDSLFSPLYNRPT
jgi:NADP-dependent 3-hydroxy acid dehydrogenase YdfG